MDVLRDRSFGKKRKLMLSPDLRKNDGSYRNCRKNSELTKNLDFSKLPVNFTDFKFKLKGKKRKSPMRREESRKEFEEEESRELTIVKDQIPHMASFYDEKQKILNKSKCYSEHIKKSEIDNNLPISEERPIKDKKNTKLSPINCKNNFKMEILGQNSFDINNEDNSTIEKEIKFKAEKEEPIISKKVFGSNIHLSDIMPMIKNLKTEKDYQINKNFSYIKKKSKADFLEKLKAKNQKLKEDNQKSKNYIKLLDINVQRYKRELDDANEELEVAKFERINTVTYYNKACNMIKKLEKDQEHMKGEFDKTSERFSQMVDYIYRLNDSSHFSVLENILGREKKDDLDDIYHRHDKLNATLSQLIDMVYLSNCSELKDEVSKLIKRKKRNK